MEEFRRLSFKFVTVSRKARVILSDESNLICHPVQIEGNPDHMIEEGCHYQFKFGHALVVADFGG